jgi:hypothetical protein
MINQLIVKISNSNSNKTNSKIALVYRYNDGILRIHKHQSVLEFSVSFGLYLFAGITTEIYIPPITPMRIPRRLLNPPDAIFCIISSYQKDFYKRTN